MGTVSIVLILSPSVPQELHTVLCSVYFALSSAMACRVFRAVLLGIIKDPSMNVARGSTIPRMATSDSPNHNDEDSIQIFDKAARPSHLNVKFAVERDTRVESDGGHTFWDPVSPGDEMPYDAHYRV